MKKTTGLIAASGAVLAIGATIFSAAPAIAASTQPTSSAAVAADATDATGPQTSWNGVTITRSIVQGNEIVIEGSTKRTARVDGVRAAAGLGYQAAVPLAEDGSFEIRIRAYGDADTQGYGLQFGKGSGSDFTPQLGSRPFQWYAERV